MIAFFLPIGQFQSKIEAQINGAFFYGYTITVGSAGLITDIVGAKYIVATGIGVSGFIGLFQELAAYNSVNCFIVVRFLQGLGGFSILLLVKIKGI